jgi:predicted transcriptional regulator
MPWGISDAFIERGNDMELTKSELEIMNVIWSAGKALTRGEILELSVDKNWKDNSIHILLNRLLAKGAISESGFARSGKSYGRLYQANLTGEDYYAQNVFYGDAERMEMLFKAMLRNPEINAELLDKFTKAINKKREKLK